MNTNRVSCGRNPNCEDTCETCNFLKRAQDRDGGWCLNIKNKVPPQKGWPDGFNPSVSSTGGCDLHCKTKIELTASQMMVKVKQAINDEPELPDGMPEEMFQTMVTACDEGDKDLLEEFCRIIVRETKKGILGRIEKI